jgi:hypothetical protein
MSTEPKMFYPVEIDQSSGPEAQQGVVVLNPSESKRLIARAVAGLPEVKRAYAGGRLAVTGGTTNAYVLEELTGERVPPYQYSIGMVAGGLLTTSVKEDRVPQRFFVKGEPVQMEARDFFKTLEKGDVVIKGGNAVDDRGNAGVLVGNETGGTIGALIGIACVRGIPLIMPIGLEKLIASVPEAATGWGQLTLTYAMGLPCWLTPVSTAQVITEIQALGLLAGVRARQVAAGGVGGSEGAVVLLVEGREENLNKAVEVVKRVKGEPGVQVPRHHLS